MAVILPFVTREMATRRAQLKANETGEAWGVWQHVGLYGHRDGDIAATHDFKAQSLNRPDPPDTWALVSCVDPDQPKD